MNVNFNGIGETVATFVADDSLTQTGVPVKVSDSGTAAACDSGDAFCGVCVGLRDGYAAVQLRGFATLPASAEIDAGYRKLAVDSNGAVVVNAGGRELLVVQSTADEVGVLL